MVTRAPTTSGGHNEQSNDENETDGQAKQWHQSHAWPEANREVSATHPGPCADDDGKEGQHTQCDYCANDGGEHAFETAGWWNFAY